MKLEIVLFVVVVTVLGIVVEVVRRRRLSESYALLWLGVGLTVAVLAIARPLVDRVADALGIALGTSLVFALAILFLLMVCINLSMHVSRLEARVEALAQELALSDVHGLESSLDRLHHREDREHRPPLEAPPAVPGPAPDDPGAGDARP
jgi:hypothetical protein